MKQHSHGYWALFERLWNAKLERAMEVGPVSLTSSLDLVSFLYFLVSTSIVLVMLFGLAE
jgi:hypothetical protein